MRITQKKTYILLFVNFYIMRICSLESIPFPVHSIGTRNLILPGVFQHFIQTSTPLKDLLRFSSYSLSPLFSHWEVFDRIWHFIISLRIISRATYKNRRWELIPLVLLDDFWLISKFFFIFFFLIEILLSLFFSTYQVVFWIFHARFAAITAQANTMASTLAMVVLDSSNVRSEGAGSMCANQSRTAFA